MNSAFFGIDIGSSFTKACLVDEKGKLLGDAVMETGLSFSATGAQILKKVCMDAGLDSQDLRAKVSTGVGRETFEDRNGARTEISCLTRGAHHHFPHASTIIDIGAEDIKMVRMNDAGHEMDFKMNRKCAAGTGAFLEDIAHKLRVPLSSINEMASQADRAQEINSFCTVFAGTELIHLLRQGKDVNELARGVYGALVSRVVSMAGVGNGPLIMSGGVVAHNPVFLEVMREQAGLEPQIPPHPQTLTAFGAALFARELVS